MKYVMRIIILSLLFTVFSNIFPLYTYAYLDPGSGSYIIQVIIGVFFAGLVAVKMFWNKVKLFSKNLFSKQKNEKTEK